MKTLVLHDIRYSVTTKELLELSSQCFAAHSLGWQSFGNPRCEASNQLLSESIAVAGKLLPVASISEEEQEKMSDEEHAAFERIFTQLYLFRFKASRKRAAETEAEREVERMKEQKENREAMKLLAFICLLLQGGFAALQNISAEEWCSDNRFPAPKKKFSATGLSQFQDAELASLRDILEKDPLWELDMTWELKAKVHSDYNQDLPFGFPGGDGGFLKFNIPPSADAETILVVDKVKAIADNVELEYRGSTPEKLTEVVEIWDICIRPRPCHDFAGCLPAYKYRTKQHGTGESMEDCCALCCEAQVCTEATCSSSKYKLREGTGLLGSTEEECCDKLFCMDFKNLCSALDSAYADAWFVWFDSEVDCCNVMACKDFDCGDPDGNGLWTNKSNPEGVGHSFEHCCDKLFCKDVGCENNTKYGPEDRIGDYQCSSNTKWEKKPEVDESEDDQQLPRLGFSDEECCVPKYCKNFLCSSSTKWKSREWPEDDKTLGGSFEDRTHGLFMNECCDEMLCKDYNCTSDYDGDGKGTMYIRKKELRATEGLDTNFFKWKGSTDEDCCMPLFCSQYETKLPTKWKRKPSALLGSTDAECYEPVWCADFDGCGGEGLIEDAKHKQGSTAPECCQAVEEKAELESTFSLADCGEAELLWIESPDILKVEGIPDDTGASWLNGDYERVDDAELRGCAIWKSQHERQPYLYKHASDDVRLARIRRHRAHRRSPVCIAGLTTGIEMMPMEGSSADTLAEEVYRTQEGSKELLAEKLDLRAAEVEKQEVEVFGLGTWPGYLLKGDKYRLRWALKNEAALLQVEVDECVEHFCLPFEWPPHSSGNRCESACWERHVKRSPTHSSMLVNGWQSFGFSGVLHGAVPQPKTSMPFFSKVLVSDLYGYLFLHQNGCDAQNGGVLAGFLSQTAGFGGLAVASSESPLLALFSELQGEGRPRVSDWCYICTSGGGVAYDRVVQTYLETLAKHHGMLKPKRQPVGWCSWYCHGPFVDELLMMNLSSFEEGQSLKELKSMGLDSGELSLDLFQLDDGWQSAWGDWLRPNAKFPSLGYNTIEVHAPTPGLWMRALDTTMPEVLEHIRKTIHTIVHEWGFRYLKCDFLHCAAMPGKRFLKVSRAKACRMLLEAVREAAGEDVFVLACGAPLGPCIGVADAVRVSADTAEHWFPVGPNVWGTRWLFKQDRTNLPAARMHMNGRLWVNDPDCLIIRKEVPLSEAQALASVVAFSAGSVIFSDDLKSLPKERLAVLKALLPPVQPTAQDVHFTDGEIPCKVTAHLTGAAGDWRLCGLFAWDGGEVELMLDDQEWHVFEFWSCSYQRHRGGGLSTGPLLPRTCHLYALRPVMSKAQFLGSNIHVSCGLEVCEWEEAERSLRFTLNVKRSLNSPEVWIFLPKASQPRLGGKEAVPVHEQVWRFVLAPVPLKGLCDVDVAMEEEELVELLPPEFTRGVVLMDFQCAVVPKALCGELLKLLGPLSEDLKHLKRVRPEGTDLAVLLTETPREDVLQFLQNREITAATVQVPRFCPLTASQMESFSRYWPVKKFAHFGHLRRLAEDAGGDAGGCAMADASGRLLVACAASNGVLQHPAMVAIATVAEDARKRYAAQGKRSREEEDYLCQDCDVVLTHEPCIMCAMALIHSRVRRIAFCNENTDFGGFGGRIALEQCPNLNHHPRILRWKITIQ
eukprot:g51.t2